MKFKLYKNLLELLKNDYHRYHHSILVSFITKELLDNYHINCDEAIIGALYHDVCKNFTKDDYLNLLGNKYYKYQDKLILHGLGGYYYLKNVLGIKNKDVLFAVKHHTELNKTNSEIAKIIYLADKIERSRNYPEVELIRKLAFTNLDLALLTFIDYQEIFLKSKNIKLTLQTLKMKKYLINKGVKLVR